MSVAQEAHVIDVVGNSRCGYCFSIRASVGERRVRAAASYRCSVRRMKDDFNGREEEELQAVKMYK